MTKDVLPTGEALVIGDAFVEGALMNGEAQ